MTTPPFYFPQVNKTRTNVHLRYQMMVWGNKNCWKISFVVITFLDNTTFHPFTRTQMLFSSSLVNQTPSPPAHFPQVFPQVSCFPSLQPPPPLFSQSANEKNLRYLSTVPNRYYQQMSLYVLSQMYYHAFGYIPTIATGL